MARIVHEKPSLGLRGCRLFVLNSTVFNGFMLTQRANCDAMRKPTLFCSGVDAMNRTLYQFPLSHYCEKARWLLDFKDLDYSVKNLFPGAHRPFTLWRANSNTLPMLHDNKEWIADSSEIAFYLDAKYLLRPLLSSNPALRSKAITIEELADKAGVHVRRWAYGQILQGNEVMNVMLDDYPFAKPFKKQIAPFMRQGVARLYKVTPEKTAISLEKLMEAIITLEQMLQQNGGRYFVGNTLGLADIAVASLFAPLLAIPGTPWESLKPSTDLLQRMYDDLLERPFGQWILRVYAEERHAKGNWRGD